jgi:hypothetical protein
MMWSSHNFDTILALLGGTEEKNGNLRQYSPSSFSDLNPGPGKYRAVI